MSKKDPRRSQDAAGIGPYARERTRLVPLGVMRGWNVVSGEADIRSWEVKTLSGRLLGNVRELLIDAQAGEVVMLDIDLAGTDRHAYVPIRAVEIDRTKRIVRTDSGDLEEHSDEGPRLSTSDLSKVKRDVNYANRSRERVVERRPIVEETAPRRRMTDEPETRL